MPVLSYAELKDVWTRNGGDPAFADIAAAIALAESGGRSDVVSKPNRNGTFDNGLWQINQPSPTPDLLTPDANAKIAIAMSHNGQTWRPWCTAYSDAACGTKGGTYLGSSAPFWPKIAAGSKIPGNAAFPKVTDQHAAPPPNVSALKADQQTVDDSTAALKLFGFTVLTVSQGRAVTSVLCIAGGVTIAAVGVILLAGRSVPTPPVPGLPNPVGRVQDWRLNRQIDKGSQASPDQAAQKASYEQAKKGVTRLPTGEQVAATPDQPGRF